MFRSDPAVTFERLQQLTAYMEANVLVSACHDGGEFVCPSVEECKTSATGSDFHEGQLSHVGEHYDLYRDGEPLRVVVVGQEYGQALSLIGLAARRQMILTSSGRNSSYYAGAGRGSRNPHMRGTTTILRLLTGGQPGDDRAGEFLALESGERVHLFDAFALVNVLLCGAHRPGTVSGSSTRVMRELCQRHFVETLRVLEPTVVVLQGLGVSRWTRRLFETVKPLGDHAERARFAGRDLYLCRFTHPSARGTQRWGDRLDAPYLREVVEPTVRLVRSRLRA